MAAADNLRAETALPVHSGTADRSRDKDEQQTTTGQLGVSATWLFLAFAGFAIALGGLSAFQHYLNDDKGNNDEWALPSNYPVLTDHKIFRFDWFVVFLQFWLVCTLAGIIFSGQIRQARGAAIGYLGVTTVLVVICCDRFYNVRAFVSREKRYWRSTNCTFAGFIVSAISDFMLIYCLGVDSAVWPF
jgi:hypothetical protein